jgi:hypothetical protein
MKARRALDDHDNTRPQEPTLTLLPVTRANMLNRVREGWKHLQEKETTHATAMDVERAAFLAEHLGQEMREGKVKEADLAEACACSQVRISQLLRYHRFLDFAHSVNKTTVLLPISEGRFREYWHQMSDPAETRGKRKKDYIDAYERRIFLGIVEWVEQGKAPFKFEKKAPRMTAEEMFKKKRPLAAFRKEYGRILKEEVTPLVTKAMGYFGRDRSSYSPDFMALAMRDLGTCLQNFQTLLDEFDRYSE